MGLALALAACGSTSKAPASNANALKPSAKYVVRLSGTAEPRGGASTGVGDAVIALHDGVSQLCWRFSHLHGFTGATTAIIARGAPHRDGRLTVALSATSALHHRGCVKTTAATLSAIAAQPGAYYVNVHSTTSPKGAVRGQL